MTENEIRSLFRSMKKLKAKREMLEYLEKVDGEYDQICKILYVMENSLDILNANERDHSDAFSGRIYMGTGDHTI